MDNSPKRYTSPSLISVIKKKLSSERNTNRGVCIDYFDTIASRSVSPEYTKKLAAKQLIAACGLKLSPQALYEIRNELEGRLCIKNHSIGNDPEFDLYQLGGQLFKLLGVIGSVQVIRRGVDNFIELFVSIEIAVELQVQFLNNELAEFLRGLKASGTSVYLVSDFYIPKSSFWKMLESHNIAQVFSDIFISADCGLTKSSGRLYEKVLESTGYRPEELIMIGDNRHSDFTVPVAKGVESYLIDTGKQRLAYTLYEQNNRSKQQRETNLAARLQQSIKENHIPYFPEMGVTLWFFIVKLFRQLITDEVRDVFFCSKEGEFLKVLFDEYQRIVLGTHWVRSHYLLVSRKATFICSLQPLEKETFDRLFDHYRDISIEEFLLSLNFTTDDVARICKQAGVAQSGRRQDLRSHDDLHRVLDSDLFRSLYENHRQEQRAGFRSYLNSFPVPYEEDGLTLVDVGWKGSIQNNIHHALDGKVLVRGYYIGLLSPTELSGTNRKTGIIFSDYPIHSPYIHVYNNNRSLFEMLLGASHGSADGYFEMNNNSLPNADPMRKISKKVAGDICYGVATLDLPEERKLFRQLIGPLQKQYLGMFTEITRVYLESEAGLPVEEWFARLHSRMVFKPKKREVSFFSKLYHLENFGLFEFTDFATREDARLIDRLKNLKRLVQSPAAYLETGVWPPIILQRLGLEFLQPIDGVKRYRRVFKGE